MTIAPLAVIRAGDDPPGLLATLREAVRGAILGTPRWSDALVGALLRGGWLALALPLAVLPDPVAFSTLVGPDLVQASGISERVLLLLLVALTILVVIVVVALWGAAAADLAVFEQVAGGPLGRRRSWGAPGSGSPSLAGRARRRLHLELAALQVAALVPFLVALGPALLQLVDVTRSEILLPSSYDRPLVARVVADAWPTLLLLAALLLVADLLHALATRALLLGRSGLAERTGRRASAAGALLIGLGWLVSRPRDWLLAFAVGWFATLLGLAVGGGVLLLVWPAVRDAFLAPPAASLPVPLEVAALVAIALALAAALVLALVVSAVAAAIRAAIWTATLLR